MANDYFNPNGPQVVPSYIAVKYAIMGKWSDVLGLFIRYVEKPNKFTEKELQAQLGALVLLLLTAYGQHMDRFFKKVPKDLKLDTFKKVVDRITNQKEIDVYKEEIVPLIAEIPYVMNFMGITDIVLKSASMGDYFAGM